MVISRRLITVGRPGSSPVGTIIAPPDKSITHRALFLGALNRGVTHIENPSTAADCRSTFELLRALGYHLDTSPGEWTIDGTRRISHPDRMTIDCGNSGTTARMAMGFLTGERGEFTLIGDASLSLRPMERVALPLRSLGAQVSTTDGALPVIVCGSGGVPGNADNVIEVASAQVHAALALAALRSDTGALIRRLRPMRDHTRRMLHRLGLLRAGGGAEASDVEQISAAVIDCDMSIKVPGDPSSAAFIIAAAVLVPGSQVVVSNVGLNPSRISFLRTLRRMEADISWSVTAMEGGEPVGEVTARYSPVLRAVQLPDCSGSDGETETVAVAEMLDELPLLALVGARAEGRTAVRDAKELRVKESDRIAATVSMMSMLGVPMEEFEDGFAVTGPSVLKGGAVVEHRGDHRLAMTAAVAGLIAERPIDIPDPDVVAVSYPDFWNDLRMLSATEFLT